MKEVINRYTLKKEERLSSESRINDLFTNGKSFISFPLRCIYVRKLDDTISPPVSIFISVPKRKIKVVPKRNRIKRLIREAYRLNKYQFIEILQSNEKIDIALLYLQNEPVSYMEIENSLLKIAVKLRHHLIR